MIRVADGLGEKKWRRAASKFQEEHETLLLQNFIPIFPHPGRKKKKTQPYHNKTTNKSLSPQEPRKAGEVNVMKGNVFVSAKYNPWELILNKIQIIGNPSNSSRAWMTRTTWLFLWRGGRGDFPVKWDDLISRDTFFFSINVIFFLKKKRQVFIEDFFYSKKKFSFFSPYANGPGNKLASEGSMLLSKVSHIAQSTCWRWKNLLENNSFPSSGVNFFLKKKKISDQKSRPLIPSWRSVHSPSPNTLSYFPSNFFFFLAPRESLQDGFSPFWIFFWEQQFSSCLPRQMTRNTMTKYPEM